jgi:hypothetical protein
VILTISVLFALAVQSSPAATIAPCIDKGPQLPIPPGVSDAQACSLYELAFQDQPGAPESVTLQLLKSTFTGYLVLCETGCDSNTPPANNTQVSDVVVFMNDPTAPAAQTIVQLVSDPFPQSSLVDTAVLCGTNFNSPNCVLPDGTHPDEQTEFRTELGTEGQVELTVYDAKVGQPGGPPCCGTNTFNIYSDGAPEPATWNLLALGLGAFAAALRLRRLRRNH